MFGFVFVVLLVEAGLSAFLSEAFLTQDVNGIGKPGTIIKSVLPDENDVLLDTTTTQREPRNQQATFPPRAIVSFFVNVLKKQRELSQRQNGSLCS